MTINSQTSGDGSAKDPFELNGSDQPMFSPWKIVVFPLIIVTLFLVLFELGLFVGGVDPVLLHDDPFVGFAENIPLYVEKKDPPASRIMETAPNKLAYFNHQTFPHQKQPGTFRIFCLGGSTTYGRPYNDSIYFWVMGYLRP